MANKKKKKKNPPSQVNKAAAEAKAKARIQDAPVEGKVSAPPKKNVAARKAAPAPKKKGLSATAQWAIIGLAGAAILFVFVLLPPITDAADDGGPGDVTVQAFDLPVLDDQDNPDNRVRISDFDGTPTVVNFFASWCTACEDELPAFRDTALALEGEVDFIFVNSNESGNWEPMAERTGIREGFTIAQDIQGLSRNGLYRSLGGTNAMPITAFYDANGNLVDTVFAPFNESQLNAQIDALGFTS